MKDVAVKIDSVSKVYKLYDKPSLRLKEALNPFQKKYHNEHYALENVSLEIHEGECVGIIGTNGSGKSTLLKIITGVLNPTTGSVEVNGKISALLELGAGFNMEYTGIENIYLNGTMLGYSKQEVDEKVQDILDFAEIGDFIYQPVKTYSSGMFARLAFAVAINVEPDILIVDEALSVGDIFFQSKCYRKFNEFKDNGKTIIFVSHDLSSIIKYCDRSLLLNQGKEIAVGPSQEVVDIFKKIQVNQFDKVKEESVIVKSSQVKDTNWKSMMVTNPNYLDYGDGRARIIDYAVMDENDNIVAAVHKDCIFKIKFRVQFNENLDNPIFAYTVKDIKGTEVTGTNTVLEDKNLGNVKKGDVITITFEQRMIIQGGQYLLSLGCTGYENDEFVVYHRLYDICNVEVISSNNKIGFFDIHSKVIYD